MAREQRGALVIALILKMFRSIYFSKLMPRIEPTFLDKDHVAQYNSQVFRSKRNRDLRRLPVIFEYSSAHYKDTVNPKFCVLFLTKLMVSAKPKTNDNVIPDIGTRN